MLKIENTQVYGWEPAIRGMRNPMNSWDKSDSFIGCGEIGKNGGIHEWPYCGEYCKDECHFVVGANDLALMKKLAKAGSDHRKFMRMIVVYVDVTAPLYWWKEADTYKVGTVANSCSTMHTLHERELTLDDFSHEHLITAGIGILDCIIEALNEARDSYLDFNNLWGKDLLDDEITSKKHLWYQMIQLLPSSYNQKRTWMLNYEVLRNIYHARKNHKLDEWVKFCKWIETLPYSEIITGGEEAAE